MNKKIRIAMIGCGHIAPRWLDVISNNTELELVKPYKTSISTFETYRCTECGNLMRERKAVKRETLVNVN